MKTVDPITTEIIRNAFISIANDMNATLIRSAFTPIIYEGKDCSIALIDEKGEVLGQSLGLPLFLGNLEICVKLISLAMEMNALRMISVVIGSTVFITRSSAA